MAIQIQALTSVQEQLLGTSMALASEQIAAARTILKIAHGDQNFTTVQIMAAAQIIAINYNSLATHAKNA